MPRAPKYQAVAPASLPKCPRSLFLGTSGWSYPTWKPDFYSPDVPARAFLHYYSSRFPSVEVNHTFRKPLAKNVLQTWLQATPPGFRFAFKAPEQITHRKRLVECHEAVDAFVHSVTPAKEAGKLAPVLFQLPPNFKLNVPRLLHLLQTPSLQGAAGGMQIAIEFRHPSWFCEETYAVLKEHAAALCVADSDDLITPDISTAPFRYYRFRRNGGYSARTLSLRAEALVNAARTSEVFCYLKHEDEPTGALNALQLIKRALKIQDAHGARN